MKNRPDAVAIEEVERKFHRLLELDRNSTEFAPLFEEVDRLLGLWLRAEKEGKSVESVPYAHTAV